MKAKYGSDYDPNTSGSELSTDSESADSEDEDGEELTPHVDVAIFRTLARIKKRDPAIYDSSKDIFGGVFSSSPHRMVFNISRGTAGCQICLYEWTSQVEGESGLPKTNIYVSSYK